MSEATGPVPMETQLVNIVFPGDTNHHGTLFGGIGLAFMDKVAFIAASRHSYVDFVTASCEHVDFQEPAYVGDIVEFTGRVVRVGRRSLTAHVEMTAEAPLTGQRRQCGRGVFNMVSVGEVAREPGFALPPLTPAPKPFSGQPLRMVELVMPGHTSHYGSLYGGHALATMAKAAFVAATRLSRKTMVLISSQRVDFESQIQVGEVIEVVPQVAKVGRSSITVDVELLAENLRSGDRRSCGHGTYVMVAVDAKHHATDATTASA